MYPIPTSSSANSSCAASTPNNNSQQRYGQEAWWRKNIQPTPQNPYLTTQQPLQLQQQPLQQQPQQPGEWFATTSGAERGEPGDRGRLPPLKNGSFLQPVNVVNHMAVTRERGFNTPSYSQPSSANSFSHLSQNYHPLASPNSSNLLTEVYPTIWRPSSGSPSFNTPPIKPIDTRFELVLEASTALLPSLIGLSGNSGGSPVSHNSSEHLAANGGGGGGGGGSGEKEVKKEPPPPMVYINKNQGYGMLLKDNLLNHASIFPQPPNMFGTPAYFALPPAAQDKRNFVNGAASMTGDMLLEERDEDEDEERGWNLTTLRLTFHEQIHRSSCNKHWTVWHSQHSILKNNTAATTGASTDCKAQLSRVISICPNESSGVRLLYRKSATPGATEEGVDEEDFDRVSFVWDGVMGAKAQLKLHCLSTDFSRIKGVKGIPLRLVSETITVKSISEAKKWLQKRRLGEFMGEAERSFVSVKLFRDKGAERKNKDDIKHLQKQLEKMGTSLLIGNRPGFTCMVKDTEPIPGEELQPLEVDWRRLSVQGLMLPQGVGGVDMELKRSGTTNGDSSDLEMDDRPPPRKRRNIVKSVLVRYLPSQPPVVYRAVYLEESTVGELKRRLLEKLGVVEETVGIYRVVMSGGENVEQMVYHEVLVEMDDEMVEKLEEEQTMVVYYDQTQRRLLVCCNIL